MNYYYSLSEEAEEIIMVKDPDETFQELPEELTVIMDQVNETSIPVITIDNEESGDHENQSQKLRPTPSPSQNKDESMDITITAEYKNPVVVLERLRVSEIKKEVEPAELVTVSDVKPLRPSFVKTNLLNSTVSLVSTISFSFWLTFIVISFSFFLC